MDEKIAPHRAILFFVTIIVKPELMLVQGLQVNRQCVLYQ